LCRSIIQAAFARTHEAGTYLERIDYSRSFQPSLSPQNQAWANELIGRAT